MKKSNKNGIIYYYDDEKYLKLIDKVLTNRLDEKKILKNDARSKVVLIEFQGEMLVVKEPKEKNGRKWQKLLAIFRGSEAFREYRNCEKIKKSGFDGTEPVLAIETKKSIFIDKSYLVTRFIEGKEGKISNLEKVKDVLEKVHEKGFLHGDSQLANFMIDKDKVYLVDCKLMKNVYGKFGARYEFIYLEESCDRNIDIYPKNDIYYKGAKALNSYRHFLGRMKKKIRGKK